MFEESYSAAFSKDDNNKIDDPGKDVKKGRGRAGDN